MSEKNKKKKKYIRPSIISEPLMTFGGICNGTTHARRKTTTGAPGFCDSKRLLS